MITMLSIDDIHVSFGKREILSGITLELEPGAIIALSGKSGSGKTTLFGVMSGLLKPKRGRVLYGGKNIYRWTDLRRSRYRNREIGYVFQTFNLLPNLTARDNIILPAVLNRHVKNLKGHVDYLVDYLDLGAIIGQFPATLSGGEKQRIAIARALVNSPGIILADEPTGNLDDENGGRIFSLFREICAERKICVLIATHDAGILADADAHFHLAGGRLEKIFSGKKSGKVKR
jgi:putative ABC transport system ATP-binding protein